MAEQTITKIFAALGFTFDDKDLMKFKVGMTVAIGTLAKFTADTIKATVALDNMTKRTGVSGEFVKDWQIMAEQSNIQASSIEQAINRIVDMKGRMLAGEGVSSDWGILGISGTESTEEIFEKVISNVGKIEDANLRLKRLGAIGFDTQFVNFIGKSREELDSFVKSFQLTDKESERVLELANSFTDLNIALRNVKDKFVANFYPIRFTVDLIKRMIYIVNDVIQNTLGWDSTMKVLGITFGILIRRFAPMTTAITGLMLIIDDLWTYFKGGTSATGYFIDFLKEANPLIGALSIAVAGLTALFVLSPLVQFGKGFLSMISIMKLAIFDLDKVIMASKIGLILAGGTALFKLYQKLDKDFKGIGMEEGTITAKIGDVLLNMTDKIKEAFSGSKPIVDQMGNSGNIPVVNNIQPVYNINGAKNPQAVAEETDRLFLNELNKSSLYFGGVN